MHKVVAEHDEVRFPVYNSHCVIFEWQWDISQTLVIGDSKTTPQTEQTGIDK